jgi:hypothetical protein
MPKRHIPLGLDFESTLLIYVKDPISFRAFSSILSMWFWIYISNSTNPFFQCIYSKLPIYLTTKGGFRNKEWEEKLWNIVGPFIQSNYQFSGKKSSNKSINRDTKVLKNVGLAWLLDVEELKRELKHIATGLFCRLPKCSANVLR